MVKRVIGLCTLVVLILTSTSTFASLQPLSTTERSGVSHNVYDKIHPDLQRDIDQAFQVDQDVSLRSTTPTTSLEFMARVKADTNLDLYTDEWFTRPFVDPLGNTVAIGTAAPTSILKMATSSEVLAIQRPESLIPHPKPVAPEIETPLNRQLATEIDSMLAGGPAPTGWYHTGIAIHGAQAAWDKGYTGTGVRYMSNDSGADYCHPDLLGTWAYIDTLDSPYYGLPQMFDSYSSYLAAQDYYLETDAVASGQTDYADTSMTFKRAPSWVWNRLPPSEHTITYEPIGAEEEHTYILPGTSRSGLYKIGSHPDKALARSAETLSEEFGDGTAVANERAAVLVVDSDESEVYDTVYVDLNYNFDFRDERPARIYLGTEPVDPRERTGYHEAACLDFNDDGLNDVSGGLIYFIADGETAIPTLDWYWGVPGDTYGNGDLVAFHVMDYAERGGTHGMGTTSVAVGQGVVSGSVFFGPDGPPQADGKGLVVGAGKNMASTQNGNFYITPFVEDAFIYAGLGYDGVEGTADDIQLVNNSWVNSSIDNEGFDSDSRLIDYINRTLAPHSAFLFATGNGAPGYGTNGHPTPPASISVGATTLFDTVGPFSSVRSADQIVGGDVVSWSNRGPGATTDAVPDVVATGAFGAGSVALNQVLNGSIATASFSGTSMATPVAASNLGLIYEAWYERTGEWPTFTEAKEILMNSATDINHNVWLQGAGMVNADVGTDVAAGFNSIRTSPADWSAGDYRGEEYEAFAKILHPGSVDIQIFTLNNYGNASQQVDITTSRLTRIDTQDYSFTTLDQSLANEANGGTFGEPDYIFPIDGDIPEDTDMVQLQLMSPYEQFDPDDNLSEPFNSWALYLYDWTDLDDDGALWVDTDENGKVTVTYDDDGNVIESELDATEIAPFNYSATTGPTQQIRVREPLSRMSDGIALGVRHTSQAPEVPVTDLTIEASFWEKVPWEWVSFNRSAFTVPANGRATFNATMRIPEGTPYGMYEGAIEIDDGTSITVIPISVAVAASGTQFTFGGEEQADTLYDNSHVSGYTNYRWRAESGDWRFFWADIMADDVPESGTSYLVVDTAWENEGTDIDTLIMGPEPSIIPPNLPGGDVPYPTDIYGPYTIETVGGSPNTHIGAGRWLYRTSSGGAREIVAALANEGLHGIFLHQVKSEGMLLDEPFVGNTGLVTIDPGVIEVTESISDSVSVDIISGLAFDGVTTSGAGLSQPTTTRETAQQDDPGDPTSASVVTTIEIDNGALLEVTTDNLATSADIDLFVYGPDDQLVGSSTSPTGDESVSILAPEDGTYTIAVLGWSVPTETVRFDLMINAIQGNDVTVSDIPDSLPADGTATFSISWDVTDKETGTYNGLVFIGVEGASELFTIPLEITVE